MHGRYDIAEAQNQCDVEDIAAKGITQGKVVASLAGGHHAGGKFGQTGSAGQDGQSDDTLTHPPGTRQFGGIVHEPLSASHQRCHTDDEQKHEFPYWLNVLGLLGRFGLILLVLALCHKKIVKENGENAQEQDALNAAQLAIASHKEKHHSHTEAQRHITIKRNTRNGNLHGHGGSSDDDKRIEDVAAHDVSHTHVAAAADAAEKTYNQLGQTGSHRHNGKTDHQFAHIPTACHATGSVGKLVRTPKHEGGSDQKQYNIH